MIQSVLQNRRLVIPFWLVLVSLALSIAQSPFSIFVYHDGLLLHYPAKKILIDQLKHGQIPYWNPAASFGQPLLANPNIEPFYPDNLLFLVLSFDIAWNFHFWFHWLWGMLGIFMLLRSLDREPQIALMGSTFWGGSGYFLSLFAFFNLIAATAWIPWILYSTLILLQRPGMQAVGFLSACYGFQLLAGEPVTSFASLLTMFFLLIDWRKDLTIRKLTLILLSFFLAFLIALPQFLALREVYPILSRSRIQHVFDVSSWFSFEPRRIWEWVIPYSNGLPYEKAPHLNPVSLVQYFSSMLIPSVHLSLLLLFGFLIGIRKPGYNMPAALALFFLLTLGRYGPIWQWLYRTIPGFDELRFPIKFFGPFLMFMILVSTKGLQHYFVKSRKPFSLKSNALFLLLVAVAMISYIWKANPTASQWSQIAIALILFLLLITLCLYRKELLLGFVIVEALLGARFLWLGISKNDLQTASVLPGFRTYFSPKAYLHETVFKDISDLYRARTQTAYPLYGAVQGFRYAFDSSLDGMYSFYNDYLCAFISSFPVEKQFQILSRLGVNQIITPEDLSLAEWQKSKQNHLFVYSRKTSTSLFTTHTVVTKASLEQALKGLAEGKGPFSRWVVNHPRFEAPAKIKFREIAPSRFEFQLENDRPTFIVSRITYVNCWKMKVFFRDGTAAVIPVNQIDGAFVGMETPAGARKITLYYQSMVMGNVLIAWMGLLLGVAVLCVRSRFPRNQIN